MGMIVSWMLVAAAIGAFAVTALSGCFVIPALHKLHFGQTIRESGPTWHNKKQGTPTMGGLCFIFGILVACGLVYAGFYRYAQDLLGIVQVRAALLALFLAFGSGFIGFLDDYIKVVKHRNLGLLAWQKLIMQFIVTGGFLVGLHMQGLLTTIIMLPFIGAVDLGWVYYPIAFFGIIFLVNAVNLTDGLDGLCSCVTFVSMLGYLLAASMPQLLSCGRSGGGNGCCGSGLPGVELLPGQSVHGRYRQHVPGRYGNGPCLYHGPAQSWCSSLALCISGTP